MTAQRGSRSPAWWTFGIDCVLAVVIRLLLAWETPGQAGDVHMFQSWGATLRSHPLHQFYTSDGAAPDHLPGDLWLLKVTVEVFDFLGGHNVHGSVFTLLLQAIPTMGDLLAALMLLLIVRERKDMLLGVRCARWYLFNPATIILTGLWGQWDSVSLGLLLTGVWLLLQDRWWLASAPIFAWAVLVKPQLALAVVFFAVLLGPERLRPRGRAFRNPPWRVPALVAGWFGLGVAMAYVLLAPFDVHLLRASHGGFTLDERVQVAVSAWPYTTLGAANAWILPTGSLHRVRDDTPGLLGLTAEQWGIIGVAVIVVCIAVGCSVMLRRSDPLTTALWAGSASLLGAFLVGTRVHERYALPALGLCLALTAVRGFERPLNRTFWLLSACLSINLLLVLHRGLGGPVVWVGLSLTYCGLTLYLLALPRRAGRRSTGTPDPIGAGAVSVRA
jgi:hypothetical protein